VTVEVAHEVAVACPSPSGASTASPQHGDAGAGVESFISLVTARPGHIGSTEAIDIAKDVLAAGRCAA
jgi:hypothetical protein